MHGGAHSIFFLKNTILNAKDEKSPGVFLYEQSVPSKWLGQKVLMKPLGGEMEARSVGVLPSVDMGRKSELSQNVVIDVLVINLSDEPTPFKRGEPVGEAMRVGDLQPRGLTKGMGGRSRGKVGEVRRGEIR